MGDASRSERVTNAEQDLERAGDVVQAPAKLHARSLVIQLDPHADATHPVACRTGARVVDAAGVEERQPRQAAAAELLPHLTGDEQHPLTRSFLESVAAHAA